VEQISGLWDILERATDSYLAEIAGDPNPMSVYEWASHYPEPVGFSLATFFFLLLVPGPLTLGLSLIWLRVIRGQVCYADMVFSGFGNFFRSMMLNLIRCVFIALWSILLFIPGVIAYYRYSQAFFLLVDNPSMTPYTAIALSKYYMRDNKGNRFVLDLSFIGWFVLSAFILYFLNNLTIVIIVFNGYEASFFISQMVMCGLGSVIFAPLVAYRGVAAAEYYHRVICAAPDSFEDPLLK